jgi:hypothetical protein
LLERRKDLALGEVARDSEKDEGVRPLSCHPSISSVALGPVNDGRV